MNLSQTLTVLSSMITPVVLIMASGSLIMTTSQRLGRVIERSRKLTDKLKELVKDNVAPEVLEKEGTILFEQLTKSTQRARLLQQAMATLYLTLSMFVATSITIGIVDIVNSNYTWLPILLSTIGAGMLFHASLLLIRESRVAVSAVNEEMDYALLYFQRNLPTLPKGHKMKWWRKILTLQRARTNKVPTS
ncbi:DUF2721 domain-containing protein [Rhabdobacter roseus]|uniref:Co/Zn/Cd efflux system component n=1 Tax=Rhabdobacter roseus TaxID=1655419 RepID=A0A840TTX1_9BACT|nr:DUF2721 domain-containing protein [Rhabdobacter roseus]MBB5283440.1 Co/Zn/Cd efflux system component [Rhabdobacter roseus]